MPAPLIIKRPKVAPWVEQIFAVSVIGGPFYGLFYCWDHHVNIHLADPWMNLGVHFGLIAIPLIWVGLITSRAIQFEPTEEISLGRTSFFKKLPVDWWMMFLMWPALIVAVLGLGYESLTQYAMHPESLSTTPRHALAIMAVTFLFGAFYVTVLLGQSEPRTLISPAGLRTGMLRFYEWENIHHLSRRGDLYSIYHRANPALPMASFMPEDREAQATLEWFIAEHHVLVTNEEHRSFARVKFAVIAGFLFILLLSVGLRLGTSLTLLWIDLIAFGVGIILTMLLERVRGISKLSKYKPIIEPAAD
ncbi:MAG: hypothetical protein JWR26_101 [Pedosphaera sp.]|nr:hypothetical protein [Pedosphaera sp.]